ncbi:MAG: FIST C-terminal domain-containing protein [Chloroflexi bacterium]|nr:FIST C-terminal domain-containing protein [Chloroflexota bacterium]
MLFASATTTEHNPNAAVGALAAQIGARGIEHRPDLVLAFLSGHSARTAREIAESLNAALDPRVLAACTAEGVIGHEEEIEREPAVAIVAARLPGVELAPFAIQADEWRDVLGGAEAFRRAVAAPEAVKMFILIADPFTSPMDEVLEAFNTHYPGVPVIGGMASGAQMPGGNLLVLNHQYLNAGGVGISLAGSFDVEIVVSQGCRPIGRPLTVTGAEDNIILGIEGKPAFIEVRELFATLSEEERALLQNGLFVGRAIKPVDEEVGRGDFLIRGVLGGDPESGAMAIGDTIGEGETIQFHVRDAATAQEDLEMMLLPQTFRDPPAGAFLFSCNGRGRRLYDHPNGDISAIQQMIGVMPLAGFFCAGEIGPIGGKNFLHGHTASLALIRPVS